MSLPSGPPERPRRRWIWIMIAVVTAIVVIVPAGLQALLTLGHQAGTQSVVLSHPIAALEVDAPANSVTIRPGPAGQVTVRSALSWVFSQPQVRRSWQRQTLRVSVSCPSGPFQDCGADLQIRVPGDVSVTAQVTSGNVTVTGLTGRLRLLATSGNVTMTDVRGGVTAQATSGNVTGTLLSAAVFYAAVTSGNLALQFTGPPQQVRLQVASGNADITVPPGSRYRLPGSRGSGSWAIASGLSISTASRVIEVMAGSGNVTVGYLGGG